MQDLSNSVIMPQEDFLMLQEAAWNQPKVTIGDRVATDVQTLVFCTILGGAILAVTWGWHKAADWREEKHYQRSAEADYMNNLE